MAVQNKYEQNNNSPRSKDSLDQKRSFKYISKKEVN